MSIATQKSKKPLNLKPTPTVSGADLPYEDSHSLETEWHIDSINMLIHLLKHHTQDRDDIYIAGNMFVYFDPNQVKEKRFRGPDFFVVKNVESNHNRKSWVIWEEDGLTPDVVIELASISTVRFDETDKKEIYEQILQTPEYFVYNPDTDILRGWQLLGGRYVTIVPNKQGWLWSKQLALWIGIIEGRFSKNSASQKIVRFFDENGKLLPTKAEAEAEARHIAQQHIEKIYQPTEHIE